MRTEVRYLRRIDGETCSVLAEKIGRPGFREFEDDPESRPQDGPSSGSDR